MDGFGIRVVLAAAIALVLAVAAPGVATAQPAGATPADPWPRAVAVGGGATLLVHQPQVESWDQNRLALRAAITLRPAGGAPPSFGAVWATARTHVDRVSRRVGLEDVEITRVGFPTLADGGQRYKGPLQAKFGQTRQTIALDRLETSLAAGKADPPTGIAVRNDPPRVIVSQTPAILIQVDGNPVFKPVANTGFERLINTRVLILRQTLTGQQDNTVNLRVYGGWLIANGLAGDWSRPAAPLAGLDAIAAALAPTGRVDLLGGGSATPKPSLANGVPAITVSFTPAELVVFRGPPSFQPIAGTNLAWATNTASDVIRDGDGNINLLLAGRWFRSAALSGPWSYVPSPTLPPDFRRIPPDSPAGVVLAAVSGTPQAREAAIANTIPQTATVPRVGGPSFSPVFDDAPQLRAIESTALQVVANSPTPIIRAEDGTFYALRAGVWFYATAIAGPWYVAPAVPAAIYAIPPSSPLHYVTYARIYGSTAKVVYAGYTPGYLGTVLNTDGVVVFGTGYANQAWAGTAWYPAPTTYGVMAQPVHNPATGWSYGFATGATTSDVAGGGAFHPANPGTGARCCGSTAANVFASYGYAAGSGPQAAGARPTPTGIASGRYVAPVSPGASGPTWSVGADGNGVYTSANGGVYRRTADGWQQRTADGWQSTADDTTQLDEEQQARAAAQAKVSRWSVGAGNAPAGWGDRLGGGNGWDDQAGLGGGGSGGRYGGGGNQVGYGF